MVVPQYPKGDLRRMLAVLGAIDSGHCTLVQIAAVTGLDKKSVTSLIAQAGEQARVVITNFHAFKLRETLELSKGNRSLLQGRGDEIRTVET